MIDKTQWNGAGVTKQLNIKLEEITEVTIKQTEKVKNIIERLQQIFNNAIWRDTIQKLNSNKKSTYVVSYLQNVCLDLICRKYKSIFWLYSLVGYIRLNISKIISLSRDDSLFTFPKWKLKPII